MHRETMIRWLVSIALLGSFLPASSAVGQQDGSVWDLGRLDAGRT